METRLTNKHVERLLEDLQKGLSKGNLATMTKVEEYERITCDINDAIRCEIKAARHNNTGYHRPPALTEAAAIVRYWRVHLQAFRNALGLSDRKKGMQQRMTSCWRSCQKKKSSQLCDHLGKICATFSKVRENTGRNGSTSARMPSLPK